MTNTEIEAFLAIVHDGTISAAAERLYVTQPALSRRIRSLEQEIGCSLLERQKGIRGVRLTPEGEEFLAFAGKWKALWEEVNAISGKGRQQRLTLASIGSVSSYLFPAVFRRFLESEPGAQLRFHQYHSREAYLYVEQKLVDLAFVSDQRYARGVQLRPAFAEPWVLAGAMSPQVQEKTTGECVEASADAGVSPAELDPSREVRLPWNDDFDCWHRRHFADTVLPHVFLDQMSLMEEFLTGDSWAVVPLTVGSKLRERGIPVREIRDAPPPRIIWYLLPEESDNSLVPRFLALLHACLGTLPRVTSFLATPS